MYVLETSPKWNDVYLFCSHVIRSSHRTLITRIGRERPRVATHLSNAGFKRHPVLLMDTSPTILRSLGATVRTSDLHLKSLHTRIPLTRDPLKIPVPPVAASVLRMMIRMTTTLTTPLMHLPVRANYIHQRRLYHPLQRLLVHPPIFHSHLTLSSHREARPRLRAHARAPL